MAMNQVQFQHGLSMVQFLECYGAEAKCYRALYKARWPRGFRCPSCDGRARSRFRRHGRVYYQCRACRHQTTLTSGTLFAASKVPLTTWFLAMHLLTATKTNMAALELKRHLGVCYHTAWRMKQKIMEAMTEREEGRQLAGFVQDAVRQGKYARRYLAEAAYRFNRRFHLPSLLPRLVHAMVLCKPCAEPHLRSETSFLS